MEWGSFCSKISDLLGAQYVLTNEFGIRLTIDGFETPEYTVDEYAKLKDRAERFEFKGYALWGERASEVLIKTPIGFQRRYLDGKERLQLASPMDEKSTSLSIQKVSDELVWWILKDYDSNSSRLPFSRYALDHVELQEEGLFDILREVVRVPLSVYVETQEPKGRPYYQNYLNSFVFSFEYNFDQPIKVVTGREDMDFRRPFRRMRRMDNIEELTVPCVQYKQELIEQYDMAVSSNDPFVQYIGFYHVVEHFYDEVYSQHIVEEVQNEVRRPDFSIRRKKDVLRLVKKINKGVRVGEIGRGFEQDALEMTLYKYVEIDELRNGLEVIDKKLIPFYRDNIVAFSNGKTVDLHGQDIPIVFKNLAHRIYQTRNSLVHAKSNEYQLKEKGMYNPSRDRRHLENEVPLIRVIAETLIIKSSKTF